MDDAAETKLTVLLGDEVSMVVFIRDWLELAFQYGYSGPVFRSYVWPVVSLGGTETRVGEPGYRDRLCDLINRTVTGVEESRERGIVLRFDDDELRVDPAQDDLIGPEIAELDHTWGDERDRDPVTSAWVVWRPGEDIFDALR